MTWLVLLALVAAVLLAVAVRRRELIAMGHSLGEVGRAKARGSDKARLHYPSIDLTRCIGCGACQRACPEEGVLELVHGQALVAHGARCVGHGRCAVACPVGAIALTLADLARRRDIPVLDESFEVPGSPGLFLAGEVTGYALVSTAIAHGTAVANEVARRATCSSGASLDLIIVGAGPAGLACALQAKARGLSFVVLEQEELGGTVAKYPRRKLVLTQPIELPLHGKLARTSYTKEELIELWRGIARAHALPIRGGQVFVGLARDGGEWIVRTQTDQLAARCVCLALGRRGTPNKLGVPGEELPKVAYSLLDAQSYQSRRILVVGGGDSAVEAALGLAEQPGNVVTLSYRRERFTRIKERNALRLEVALGANRLSAVMSSELANIGGDAVELRVGCNGGARSLRLPNDEVFVFAGGTPPVELLERCGVSFDPALRKPVSAPADQGPGLARALALTFALAVAVLAWALWFADYYALPLQARDAAHLHTLLRPSGTLGLTCGVVATVLIGCNLAYLLRRAAALHLELGSLRAWMTSHVATGIGALLFALLHSALAPRNTVGGHALAALAVLVVTGAIGRYLYAFVPRAANGRELLLDELRTRIAALSTSWDRTDRRFGEQVHREIDQLIDAGRWRGSLLLRVRALVSSQRELGRALARLHERGRAEGVPGDQLHEILALARRAHRASLMAAHYEELRALIASWRYLHRWVALWLVLLLAVHVFVALRYGGAFSGGPR